MRSSTALGLNIRDTNVAARYSVICLVRIYDSTNRHTRPRLCAINFFRCKVGLSHQKTRAYSRRTVELDDAGYRHNPVKASRHASSRTITASEVRDWFGKSPKSQRGNAQYREIATFLTKIRWPSDVGGLLGPQPPAAKLLLETMPAMLRHWKGQLWAPETRGGQPATNHPASWANPDKRPRRDHHPRGRFDTPRVFLVTYLLQK